MEIAWYKNAIFYSLDVETFYDSNADGIGDFKGLLQKLEYISTLGITCIWLLPFFTSANRDNGYDVMDYYNVDARLGNLEDFKTFVDKARNFGLRVIIDLVVNHTSDRHPWFLEARQNRNSPYRNYYVWSDEPMAFEREALMLAGEENTMWTYDKAAGQYYLHRFYKEQPDLNIANRDVQEEILKVMDFWLGFGVDGFRIDAAEMLIETYGMPRSNKEDLLKFLNRLRERLSSINKHAILLAEVNDTPDKTEVYLHGEGRMHMLFNFYINQYLFLSLAQQNASRLVTALTALPSADKENQWLNFLRHHDELTLSLLGEQERKEIFNRFAPEKHMHIYGRGIRRRLAPMLNGDVTLISFCNSLLFSLPGAPLIRYGDELGMGDDLSLPGRISVRTPMQWSEDENAGFSRASRSELVHPVIDEGDYAYNRINVSGQQSDNNSVLNRVQAFIETRKQYPDIGNGRFSLVNSAHEQLLIHSMEGENGKTIFVHNFSEEQVYVENALIDTSGEELTLILVDSESIIKEDDSIISGYGYLWLKLAKV
jgi:maltose alpha-D-glucosyltransferase / alpha-amylase